MTAVALCGLLAAGGVSAKVSPQEAARLGQDLTVNGAEKAANKDGSIPAYAGGLTTAPPCFKKGGRYCDPFTEDKPLYTITPQNVAQYERYLSPGQRAMFAKHATYKMIVYPSRRSHAQPAWVNEATKANATRAELGGNGEAVSGAAIGTPFPIPQSAHEYMWNHKLRFRGEGGRHFNNQFAVTTAGNFNQVTLREDITFNYSQRNATPTNLDNVAIYFLQVVTAPTRLAGTITLVHETMDQVKEPRRAWQYNPGQRRLRRAPNVGYDNPGTASDGLRTNDQYDGFNGAMDRYSWKLVGKADMIVPYNSYRLASGEYKYSDIMKKSHIDQNLARYEMHRVWIVDSVTKPNTTHLYKRRTFYLDEDSWGIVLADVYDRRDQLWRWQEQHPIFYYDRPFPGAAGETIYDLQSNRYLSQAFSNEHPEFSEEKFTPSYFEPASVSKLAIR
ncbi:MAG: DUF1329 domain-containing protein [Gammaproteobacteria bacterium]